jgi:hypothetical protein
MMAGPTGNVFLFGRKLFFSVCGVQDLNQSLEMGFKFRDPNARKSNLSVKRT